MSNRTIKLDDAYATRFAELRELEKKAYDAKADYDAFARDVWRDFEREFDLRGLVLKYHHASKSVEVIDKASLTDAAMLQKIRAGQGVPHSQSSPTGAPLPNMFIKKPSLLKRITNRLRYGK